MDRSLLEGNPHSVIEGMMQWRMPVGGGPSEKTWPRCAPFVLVPFHTKPVATRASPIPYKKGALSSPDLSRPAATR